MDAGLAHGRRRRDHAPVVRRRARARGRPARARDTGTLTDPAPPPTLRGDREELAALACYVPVCGIGPIVSLLVLAFARRRPWMRFHAWQGLLLGLAAALVVALLWLGDFALEAIGLRPLGLIAVVVQLAALALYLALSLRSMIHAYHRRDAALPWVGARARRWSGLSN